jgi:hypothetical protein
VYPAFRIANANVADIAAPPIRHLDAFGDQAVIGKLRRVQLQSEF